MTKSPKWLKQYTELKYARGLVKTNQLYLGPADDWPDENDKSTIKAYENAKQCKLAIRCLNQGPERHHFWLNYAKNKEGVCLWFDRAILIKFFDSIDGIRHEPITYLTTNRFRDIGTLDDLPFYKRPSYGDEKEYRVIKELGKNDKGSSSLKFPKQALKRIYINPFLEYAECERHKEHFKYLAARHGYDFQVFRNLSKSSSEWGKIATEVATRSTAHQP